MTETTARRWEARPLQAAALRALVFVIPIASSVLFVHLVSSVVSVPTSSFWLYIGWWIGISGSATVVLFAIDRLARRLLPLVALYKLSLVFPDAAPSRFKLAMRSDTVETLEQRVAAAKAANDGSTPVEAAERLLALVADLDAHDRLTRGHSERVRAYARMIGTELRLSAEELDLLNWAALLHDVGKLSVPSEILTSPRRPTDEEWSVLRRHPELGEQLVAPLRAWLGQWAEAVAQHHERWDGRGYPRGIAGDEISLAGRIVAVADVFDVITSARSYKSAFASPAARDEIAHCAGTQFDPRVVRAFLNISLGRLRLVMGPLSWLTHLPMLGRLPLTPAIGTATASLGAVVTALTTGVIATPPAPVLASTGAPPASVRAATAPVRRVLLEDQSIVLRVGRARGTGVPTLRIVRPPTVGRVNVTAGGHLRFTPPPDFNGVASVVYSACWTGRGCRNGLVTFVVRPVNDPPVARNDVARTRGRAPVAIDVLANDTDPEGDRLAIRSVSSVRVGRAHVAGRRLVWALPSAFSGTARLRYTATDDNGGTATAVVTLRAVRARQAPRPRAAPHPLGAPPRTATPEEPPARSPAPEQPSANRAPRAAPDALSVPQGGTVVVDVLANDADPDGDPVTIASLGAPSHGTARLVGDRIQFSAPSDRVGPVTIPYTITDPGGLTDSSRITVSVLLVNAPPVFAAGPAQTVLEDSGPTQVAGWATGIGPGAVGEAGQIVGFIVTNDRESLFGAQPSVGPGGTLAFAPAADRHGRATVTVRAKDDGGTANGGVDTSPPQTFTITVEPVNDAPSFTAGPDQAVAEGAGAQTVPGWAGKITPGPADESLQAIDFVVSSDNPSLFTGGGQPRVSADGALHYTPAAGTFGVATITVRVRDDGGTANGGVDTSPPQTSTITVAAVNDPPSAKADAVPVAEDSAVGVTFDVLANDTDPDAGDTLSLVSYDASALVGGVLTANGGGSFTYLPNASFNGSESFTYVVGDGNGGTDTGTVTITVTPQPDAPTAADDSYVTQQDTPLVEAAPGILGNDGDEDGDPLTLQTTPVVAPGNGSVTIASDGSFTYTPSPGFTGDDSFTYRVGDGTGLFDTAVVTITVSASITSSVLYLAGSGPSTDVWSLTTAPPAAAAPVPDYDGDGDPGLTIKSSDGKETITDPRKWHEWVYTLPAPLALNGPVVLGLWSTIDFFRLNKAGHPHVYLYDCASGRVGCVTIAENDVHVNPWSLLPTWVSKQITVGSVTRTIAAGRELRVRLLFQHEDLWVAMTAAYPSALRVTLG